MTMKPSSSWSAVFAVCVLALVVAKPAAAESTYVGPGACKKCHIKQYKAWEKTKMSKAFDALKPNERAAEKQAAGVDPAKDYTADPECLSCHVTGYGKPGGYSVAEDDAGLRGVGCEMCHGAGGGFLADDLHSNKNKEFKTADLAPLGFVGKPTKEQCTTCHNEKSPFFKEFDFEKAKEGVHEHFKLKYEH